MLTEFVANYPIVFHIIIILASLVILVKSSDLALLGIINYAKKLGLSDYLIGLIIISLGASMPELVASLMGVVANDSGIIFGTILGSNITSITLVIGIFAIVGKKLGLNPKVLEKTEIITLSTVILPFILIIDGTLSRIDAGILIALYIGYLIYVWRKEGQFGKIKKDVKIKRLYLDGIIFILALLAILLSARWLVFSSIEIASMLNISSYVIALVVIGIGASLPDLMVGLRALSSGHKEIGIGNSLGSVVVQSLLFLGILAMIKPIKISFMSIIAAEIALLVSLSFILYLTIKKSINWKHGLILIGGYIIFILFSIFV